MLEKRHCDLGMATAVVVCFSVCVCVFCVKIRLTLLRADGNIFSLFHPLFVHLLPATKSVSVMVFNLSVLSIAKRYQEAVPPKVY